MDGETIVNKLIVSVNELVSTELENAGQAPRPKKKQVSRQACKPNLVKLDQSSAEQVDDDGLAEVLKANMLAQFQKPWGKLNIVQKLDRLTSYVQQNQEKDSSAAKLEFLTGLLSKKALTAKDVGYDVESGSIINIPRLVQTDSGEFKLSNAPIADKAHDATEGPAESVPSTTAVRKSKSKKPSNLNRILSTMKK